MATNDPTTGRLQLNAQLVEGAKGLAGPAADILSGASLLQAASGAIKGAALDKLLGPTALFAGGLTGVLAVIRNIVRESQILEKGLANIARLQQIEGKFTTLLKSAELAKKRVQELYQFTANSPFRFDDVAEANRVLQALTKGAYSGATAMQVVGDTAAATGRQFSDTAEGVGKLYAALASGRSIDKIAFQLQYAGVATEGLIGKLEALDASGAGFAEKWSEVTKVLELNRGGMKDEIKSLDALQSKLSEASALMTQAFAMPFVDSQSRSIEVLTDATKNLTPVLKAVGSDLAVISGLVTDFKTGVIENTLATQGFSTALRGAWEVGKGLFVTLTALTAIRGALGLGQAATFVGRAIGTAKGSLTGALGSEAGLAAKASGALASEALAAGNIKLAASEGFLAARFAITARAAAVKAAALEGAAGATGLAAASNGVLAATSAVAAGATSLLARAAVGAATAIRGAFAAALANPLGVTVLAIYAAISGFLALRGASQEAATELTNTKNAASDLNRELDRVEAAFETTDDWAANMNRVTDEIAKADAELARFQQRMKERSLGAKLIDSVSDAVGFGTGATEAQTEKTLRDNAANLRARRNDSFKYLPTLAPGSREAEAFSRDLRNAKDRSDTSFQNKLSLADDQAAVALLDKEIERLSKMADATLRVRDAQEKFNRSRSKIAADNALTEAKNSVDVARQAAQAGGVSLDGDLRKRRDALRGTGSRATRTSPGLAQDAFAAADANKLQAAADQADMLDRVIGATSALESAERNLAEMRRASGSEQIRNLQRIADLRQTAMSSAAARQEIQALEKRNAVLIESVRIVDDEVKKAQQLKFERQQRANAAELTDVGLGFDARINAATASGNSPEAERLSALKEIALLEKQIAQAKAQGDSGQHIQTLETQRAGVIAQRTAREKRFAEDAALERERNTGLVRGRGQDAQAVDDFKARRDLIQQYRSNGLTEEQAISDFNLSVKARNPEAPRISVDSLQAVGGGGFSSNPNNDYPRRQVALTEKMEQHLAELVRKAGQDGVIN